MPFTNRLRGRDGIEVQARGAWLCTIRDGLVARICLYQEVQAARAAAGLRE
jgi:ketosteroid isomerase-like protein